MGKLAILPCNEQLVASSQALSRLRQFARVEEIAMRLGETRKFAERPRLEFQAVLRKVHPGPFARKDEHRVSGENQIPAGRCCELLAKTQNAVSSYRALKLVVQTARLRESFLHRAVDSRMFFCRRLGFQRDALNGTIGSPAEDANGKVGSNTVRKSVF
ncbi:MAG: hypothetical protein ACTHK7_17780, partial [Aureliella sp.]